MSAAADPVLPGLWSLSPLAALVGFIVFLGIGLATGKLYTKGQHDEIVELHAERGRIQVKTIEKHEETIATQTSQITKLVESNSITSSFFQRADFVIQGEEHA